MIVLGIGVVDADALVRRAAVEQPRLLRRLAGLAVEEARHLRPLLRVEAALEQGAEDRRVDGAPIEPRGGDEIAHRGDADRQHVVIVEQPAVEPGNGRGAESPALLGHRPEQLGQHRREIVGALRRLVQDVREDSIGQEADVFGEEAEDELVDEMRDAALVMLLAQPHGDAGELAAASAVTLSRVAVGRSFSGSRKQARSICLASTERELAAAR